MGLYTVYVSTIWLLSSYIGGVFSVVTYVKMNLQLRHKKFMANVAGNDFGF